MSVKRKGWAGSPPGQKRTIQTLAGLLAFGLLLPSGMALAVPDGPVLNDDGVVQTVEPAETPVPGATVDPTMVDPVDQPRVSEEISLPVSELSDEPVEELVDNGDDTDGFPTGLIEDFSAVNGSAPGAFSQQSSVSPSAIHNWPGNWTNPSVVSRYNDWGFNICGGEYLPGRAHLGADSQGAPAGSVVKAIGSGTVKAIVGYSTGQAAIVQHKSTAGDFVAVYGHINPTIGVGATVSAGTQLGTVTYWAPSNSHLHFSVIPGAYRSGMHVWGARNCAAGETGDFGYVNPLPWLAANGPGTGSISDGSFISYEGHVYRIAGGAPIYVSTWNVFGGAQPTTPVSAAQFAALRKVPADGTFLVSAPSGHVYRVVGGAPIYVSSWNPFGGGKPTIAVDEGAINNAGAAGVYSHLNKYPADGTTISGASSGRVYVIAGGAPLYISSWNAVGGPRTAVSVDDFSIDRAGNGGLLSNLRKYPADGTYIQVIAGHVFVFAGGFPVHVDSWSAVGGGKPTTLIDQAVIDRAGESAAPYTNVRASMADGTYVHALDGRVHRAVGGALFYLNSWQAVGGQKPSTLIPEGAIKNPGTGLWKGIRTWPTEGSVARTLPSGAYYKFTGSTCVTTSATDSAVAFGDGVLPCPTKVEGPTPTISGSAVVGEKLTAKAGEWKPAPVTLAYQWLRDGSAISGATKTSYTLTNADVGKSISVTVTGSKAGYSTTSKTSAPTAKVQVKTVTKVGWVQENGKWYYYLKGVKYTGWLSTGGVWYYMNSSGVMQTGWVADGGTWYFMSSSGAMKTGWVSVSGTWYFMSSSGAMQTGWVSTGGAWYYMKASGAMHTGWLKLGSAWYYLKPSGAMVTGTYVIDGVAHRFNSSGVWLG